MEILENAAEYASKHRGGWQAHYEQNGSLDWKLYSYARNRTRISGPGVDPAGAKLLLVSTAGGYLSATQEPFHAKDPLGDYSLRTFAADTDLAELDYAHEHYDHTARKADPRVNLPLPYLRECVAKGRLGSLADDVVSISGYMPDAARIADEVAPQIVAAAMAQQAEAALLVPV